MEIVDEKVLKTSKNPSQYLGDYAVKGGPGRPPGLKNKFTKLKETLLDAFNNTPDGLEALERTIFEYRESKAILPDGTFDTSQKPIVKKYVNLEALRTIVSILPKEKEEDSGPGININALIVQLGGISTEDLRALALLARTNNSDQSISAEGSSQT